ncbi:Omega-amidase, chloroplastic [Castilleja foliolosa]|uniref:Omega-amidase, chloroplastic n=1 Tax=Castilleja foliolosa TaxID=1961234 RepID=A0ABD3D6V4_9LAMI
MASSFYPEKARVPPAVQTPNPLITKYKIGLCQLKVTADKERNIHHARSAIVEAAEKGAKLVVLPSEIGGKEEGELGDLEFGEKSAEIGVCMMMVSLHMTWCFLLV